MTLCVDEGVKVTPESQLSGGSYMRTTVAIRNSPSGRTPPRTAGARASFVTLDTTKFAACVEPDAVVRAC